MSVVARITRKEFTEFFASPAALLFLGAFLVMMLFLFFWMETFFARNIADARPLFKWLPVLLIFLAATLTMRTWSEERRAGTIENLLTSPVNRLHLVLGKFLASPTTRGGGACFDDSITRHDLAARATRLGPGHWWLSSRTISGWRLPVDRCLHERPDRQPDRRLDLDHNGLRCFLLGRIANDYRFVLNTASVGS